MLNDANGHGSGDAGEAVKAAITLTQIKPTACTRGTLATMVRYDWIQVVGVGTLVFAASVLCYLLFAM